MLSILNLVSDTTYYVSYDSLQLLLISPQCHFQLDPPSYRVYRARVPLLAVSDLVYPTPLSARVGREGPKASARNCNLFFRLAS
jgi:hypothetical protein